jgi:diguanylate cyclase (GGDEF)-like protein
LRKGVLLKKYWIIALISVLLVAGFASTLLTGYFVAYRSIGQEISQNTLPLTGDNVYSEIQKDLLTSIQISSQMASDTFVRDWVLNGEQDPLKMARYLSEIQQKYKTVTAFFVSDSTRRYYHPKGIIKAVSEADPHDAWYFRAKRMESPYEINIDADTADLSRMTVFVNWQVYGYDNNLIGVTGVGLALNKVQHILTTYQHRYQSNVFFVDKTGRVVLHADNFSFPENIHDWKNFSACSLSILTNPGFSFEHRMDNHAYFVSSRYIPEFDLILVILRNNDALNAQLKNRLKLNFLIGFLISVAVVTIVAMVLRRYHQDLEWLANTDPLTRTLSRAAFSFVFQQVVREAKRKKEALSLILVDIDNFKSINDKFGHHAGDQVLQEFARYASQKIRESDVMCRWGGEEFVILLQGCSIYEAVKIAEKIREDISRRIIDVNGRQVRVTISGGVAEYCPGESLSQLAIRADKLMYEAKRQGKDRIAFEENPNVDSLSRIKA